MHQPDPPRPRLCHPPALAAHLFGRDRRALLLGEPGTGKTTLAADLAASLARQGRRVDCLGADPGSPGFGVPAAVCLGRWDAGGWRLDALEALCSLDAARFRLPLVSAVENLAARAGSGTLLLDAPGVVRGVAGAELLEALVRVARIDLVLVLERRGQALPLARELDALHLQVARIAPSPQARRPGKAARARARTALWDAWLDTADTHAVPFRALRLLGTPPRDAPEAWRGKLVAILERGRTRTLGEVVAAGNDTLTIRLPAGSVPSDTLLVRDACRKDDGLVGTGKGFAAGLVHYIPPPDVLPDAAREASTGVRPVVQLDGAVASLMNGVFGDPLLHLRLRQRRRSLLFDLGDGSRLPARIAHQVSDVFVSHAHADHIGGFLWLLRSRIGERGGCRLYGPPGLAGHVQGFLAGIRWDRIGDRGPVFEVAELHGTRLHRWRLQAGRAAPVALDPSPAPDGILLNEAGFRVRCATLDHGIPVLAFAYEPARRVKILEQHLAARGLAPGPWLTGLKRHILRGEFDMELALPDGSRTRVEELAAALTEAVEGGALVYATDFSDTADNRRRLAALASGAHTLFCEASFLEQDREQARNTGHLSTRACGEIAGMAGVRHLIPFHFSRRYAHEPWRVYAEVAAACPQTVSPKQV